MEVIIVIFIVVIAIFLFDLIPIRTRTNWRRDLGYPPKNKRGRKIWYNDVYLKSDAWRRKRYVVLRRDDWTCVHCGDRATQVHHKRYLKKNLGKEPINWLESICSPCHKKSHRSFF